MLELLRRDPDLDAVFAYNDLMALGAIAALGEKGRSVPEDVSIVGYDDILLASVVSPALTTVRYDRAGVASEAVARLMQLSDHQYGHPEPLKIPVELVRRAST